MFDLVEHLPINNQNAKILILRQQVLDKLKRRAAMLKYELAGPVQFRVIELPLSMYVECRAAVVSSALGGNRRGR